MGVGLRVEEGRDGLPEVLRLATLQVLVRVHRHLAGVVSHGLILRMTKILRWVVMDYREFSRVSAVCQVYGVKKKSQARVIPEL